MSLSSGSPPGLFTMCGGDIGHIWFCASPVVQGPQAIIPTGALNDNHWGPAGLHWAKAEGEVRTSRVPEGEGGKVSRACSHALWLANDSPSVGRAAGARTGGDAAGQTEVCGGSSGKPTVIRERKNRHTILLQNHYIQLTNKPGRCGG